MESLPGAEVRLEKLAKAFGSAVAVDDISVTIGPGEFFTILGPSGSGKTTTMMMVAGFLYPNAGTIRISGENVANLPPQKRGLGMVFQNYAVFPHLSVFENVAFPLRVRKTLKDELKRAVEEILDLVKLGDLAGRKPRELSGGQQQRVALARALVFKPSVLLMDEPLGALDKKLRDHMQTEIRQIHQRLGVTVIYVTHDQGEALTMSNRIAIMNNGRIEQVGTPADLYDRPDSAFVADFLGDTNLIPGTLVSTDAGRGVVRADDGWTFSGVLADEKLAVGAKVLAGVRPEKIHMTGFDEKSANHCVATVEDVVYSGDVTRYHARGPAGTSFVVTTHNRMNIARHNSGESIPLAWEHPETRIFPKDSFNEG